MSERPTCCGKTMNKSGKAESGNARFCCGDCGFRTTGNDDGALGYDADTAKGMADHLRGTIKTGQKRFVITSAQNNTRVNKDFLAALEKYCQVNTCDLYVVPVHYKNPSAFTASQQYAKQWHPDVASYLIDQNVTLGGGVELAADTKIAATAANPLSGMQAVGGAKWQIIGHSQVAMEPVAAPSGVRPKRIYSTGSVTHRNYSRTKSGKVAEFHHSFGALVVEVVGRNAFIRQLGWSGGCFYDVAGGEVKKYTAQWAAKGRADRALALTTGDEHVKFIDPKVKKATYGAGGIAECLRPEYIVRHDVLDGYAGSHHHKDHPLVQFEKAQSGSDCYRKELQQVVKHINETTPKGCTNVVVDSNHHDHLQKFLDKADANKDHTNAIFIAEMQALQRKELLAGNNAGPLQLFCEPLLAVNTKWLGRSEPFVLSGVDYSQHGDVGVNGSRGSAQALAKTTYKMVIGHSHTPRICRGVYQVGKSAKRLEYESGLSTQAHTHCVQYPNGKRSLIDISAGRWRL